MFKILGLMILGIIIGYGLRRISFLRKVEVSISYTVFLLLFVLGVTIGSNRLIVDNLFSFGWQAALLAHSRAFHKAYHYVRNIGFVGYRREYFSFVDCIKIVFHF